MVPEGFSCSPKCDKDSHTPMMKYYITKFTCDVIDGKAKWTPDGGKAPNVVRMPLWRKSQVRCKSCPVPKIQSVKSRSSAAGGQTQCSEMRKLGSECSLVCPSDTKLVCNKANVTNQKCIRKSYSSFTLKWNQQPKCKCVGAEAIEKKPAKKNCSLGNGLPILPT